MKRISVTAWGIYSVWRRHAKVYQKTWLVNSLPPLSEPLIYLIAFGYGLTPLIGDVTYQGQTVSYLQFIAPGMIAVGVLFQSFFEGSFGSFIRLSYQKTWQALLTAPLSFTEVFLGDWLWATTKGSIAGILTGLVAMSLGLYSGWHLLGSLPLIILGSMLFGALGLFTAGTVRTVDQINVPIFLFVVPMFTICGTYFPRNTLPPVLGYVANILPLSALVDLLRWSLGLPQFWYLQVVWLLLWLSVFTVLAWRQIYPQLIQ
ncbi:MAG: Inner membrane transport permease YadH [Chroococcidiopsis cubana SAG 39.79]|uniref:Transport permease protein n=1 Tax=Chroococcidiopsis cubana SAG 39.79 TaxID=388085 RepID=A0AB37ULB5_9CYAN|nr:MULTISPECIES: ABC transporter permease [Chroococcidiopsis]MDZ4872600.1 Inner membrane transport permease YadH [Chroococcidiopsis cubana SAG 39.79]PSB62114.1 ABC transporter [Chroococcidiopsis cubana CCALA 043]RUT12181.1 transport permease protein [Chroococcidiopsis cubana SAG 39.79]URD49813.1 ABC transporter permease [Chroococcidiopsis sp. CCNUC1]